MTYLFYAGSKFLRVVPEQLQPEDTAEAIELSIQKWKSMIYLLERGFEIEDGGMSTCALCELFWYGGCDGCPIANKTGAYGCNGTPYIEWEALVNDEGVYDIELAQEELAFLESLKGE